MEHFASGRVAAPASIKVEVSEGREAGQLEAHAVIPLLTERPRLRLARPARPRPLQHIRHLELLRAQEEPGQLDEGLVGAVEVPLPGVQIVLYVDQEVEEEDLEVPVGQQVE